jgi:5-methylcytosine-specific restriction endonuclease McrA
MSDVLNKKVLALNNAWMPIDVISVKDAFRLVAKENAKILETINESFALYTFEGWLDLHMSEKYNKINTVSLEVPVPEIIVLTMYGDIPNKTIKFSKENLLMRDDHKCVYCQTELDMNSATIDHVVPVCKGGKTTWENCVIACKSCNHEKGHQLPTGKYKPKKKPREPFFGNYIHRLHKRHKVDSVPASWNKFLFRDNN